MLRDGPPGELARHLLRRGRMLSHGEVSVAVAHDEPIERSNLVSGAMKISDSLMTLLPRKVYSSIAHPRVLNCTLQRVPERMLLQAHA